MKIHLSYVCVFSQVLYMNRKYSSQVLHRCNEQQPPLLTAKKQTLDTAWYGNPTTPAQKAYSINEIKLKSIEIN